MEAQSASGFEFEIKLEPSGESSDDTEDSADAGKQLSYVDIFTSFTCDFE